MSSDTPDWVGFDCCGMPGAVRYNGAGCDLVTFAQPGLIDHLESMSDAALDELSFGLIGMAPNGVVEVYNATESRLSGLSRARVIGKHLFTAVAPCMNNYMIGHRFQTENELDDMIDYVFTLRMAPTRVRLRLLKRQNARRMYIAVQRP